MKVSLNTIKQYIDFDLPATEELVARINAQLGGVEEVIELGEKYKDIVIVKIVSAEQHPDADRLRVCKVDDGGVVDGVPRDDNGYVQVVCGAPNAREGIYAAWLPPKSTVPASFDEPERFVLDARELRGVLSQGMLAAADELAIGSDHDGIIEIDPEQWKPSDAEVKPGANFAAIYGLDDTIIDIENKMFTHRPDCFGQIGVAREISAILHGVTDASEGVVDTRFSNPDWYWLVPTFESAGELALDTYNDAPEKVPRVMFVAMNNIEVGPSPLWLQCALVAMGSKPVNNIVDVTNYVMLLTAQPTHAYDYDKLRGHKIGARMAKDGEAITLLNGKTYNLTSDDIVIADGEGAVGVGGIMGGRDSEVDDTTKNIVLEVATFDMFTLRKTSMRHGLFTDALTRFNKGQSRLQNDRIINLLMMSIKDVSRATQASEVFDLPTRDGLDEVSLSGEIAISTKFINDRLGSTLTIDQIGNLLRLVNFASYVSDEDSDTLVVTAPFWRTDIELPEDIVEEVGRLYGFDKLPRELPRRTMKPTAKNTQREAKQNVRAGLSRLGANEVLTYSFVHKNVIERAAQSVEKAFQIGNALSPDLQYYRLSLVPSLLDKVHMNSKAGHDDFVLFEIGKAHHKDEYDDDGLPKEFGRIAGVYASKQKPESAPYFHVKQLVEALVGQFGDVELRYQKLSNFDFGEFDQFRQLAAPFDPERSSVVWHGKQLAGVIGEPKLSVARAFKLPDNTALFELFVSFFEKLGTGESSYAPLSKFPSTSQDISLKTDTNRSYEEIYECVKNAAQSNDVGVEVQLSPVSIYKSPDDTSTKTTTFHLVFTHHDRTLTDADASAIVDSVVAAAAEAVGAQHV